MPAKKAAKKAASAAPAKKAAKKAASPAKKAPAKKAAKKTAGDASAKPAAPVNTEVAAYLNYRNRLAKGEHGDPLGDWLAAEKSKDV